MWSIWLAVGCSRLVANNDGNDEDGPEDGIEAVDAEPRVDTDRPRLIDSGTAPAPDTGAEIYTANCVACHGEDGLLGLDGAADLTRKVPGLTDAEITDVVRNGKRAMPAFALDDTDMASLLGYLRETFPAQP